MIRFLSLIFMVSAFTGGCSWFSTETQDPTLPFLEPDKKILEATEGSLEKSYDALTLLKRAEAFYREKNYIEAGGEYQRFLELHPLHRLASFVQFKLGMSYYHQIQDVDQDQEPLHKALGAFEDLLAHYPGNPYEVQAKEKIAFCRDRLAEYQLYIGRFYFKKESYPAAIYRFNKILEEFKNSPAVEEALFFLGRAFQNNGSPGRAKSVFRRLIESYPESRYQDEAMGYLGELQKEQAVDDQFAEKNL